MIESAVFMLSADKITFRYITSYMMKITFKYLEGCFDYTVFFSRVLNYCIFRIQLQAEEIFQLKETYDCAILLSEYIFFNKVTMVMEIRSPMY